MIVFNLRDSVCICSFWQKILFMLWCSFSFSLINSWLLGRTFADNDSLDSEEASRDNRRHR